MLDNKCCHSSSNRQQSWALLASLDAGYEYQKALGCIQVFHNDLAAQKLGCSSTCSINYWLVDKRPRYRTCTQQ
jgi:hypothetical protein